MCSSGCVLPDLCTNAPSLSCSILVKLFLRFCTEIYIGDFGVYLSDCLTILVRLFRQVTFEGVVKGTGFCGSGQASGAVKAQFTCETFQKGENSVLSPWKQRVAL